MRQSFRLECMAMDNGPPTMLGIHVEIMLNLVNEPQSNVYVTGDRSC